MSVAIHRDPSGPRQDERAYLFAPVSPGRTKYALPKVNPRTWHEAASDERIWGVGLKKFEAEELLDWLEANGRGARLGLVPGKGFTVWQAKSRSPRMLVEPSLSRRLQLLPHPRKRPAIRSYAFISAINRKQISQTLNASRSP